MTANSPVRAVIYDFGGPVLRLPFELLRGIEQAIDVPEGTLDWTGPFDLDADPRWRAVLHEGLSERVYWQERAEQVAHLLPEPTAAGLYAAFYDRLAVSEFIRSEAVDSLKRAKAAGLATAVLTNDIAAFRASWYDHVRFLSEVDAVVDGSLTGVLKPDPRSYRLVLDELGVEPAQAVFIDDLPRNVEGARACGLATVLMDLTDAEGSFAELDRVAGLGLADR